MCKIGDPELPWYIARFVRCVDQFKRDEAPPDRPRKLGQQLDGKGELSIELDHSTTVAGRGGYEMTRRHGQIWRCLYEAILTARNDMFNDEYRDLLVGDRNMPDFEFEIKSNADLQSVYTAIDN